jgi:hypothetical protein
MRRTIFNLAITVVLAGLLGACEASKSSNPTSPSVAGPIPGVSITTPKLLEPIANQSISNVAQPITLLIENSSTNGERTVTYTLEIAADVEFSNKVFTREGVAAGTGGRTNLTLPDALASGRTYYWRAKAGDGANASSYTAAQAFSIYTPAAIGVPTPVSPVGGTTIATNKATFVVANATKSNTSGTIYYVFEISKNDSFTSVVAVVTIPETSVETRLALANDLSYSTRYYWRVKAYDDSTTGAWSNVQNFVTPVEPTPVPTPTPTPTPSPSGWPTTGSEVVTWAKSKYPERLVAGVSLSQRQANMAFIRDRMIEAGTCGGMTLAWNLKRGGPDISIDFLTYKKNGTWIGVDIGYDYDNTSTPLALAWGEAGTDYVYPSTYTNSFSCK